MSSELCLEFSVFIGSFVLLSGVVRPVFLSHYHALYKIIMFVF